MKFIVLFKETNNIDEINNLFMNNCWNKTGINQSFRVYNVNLATLKGAISDWSLINRMTID